MVGCQVILIYCTIASSIFVSVASSHEISGCYGDTITISCAADEKINILGDFYGLPPSGDESKVCAYSENDICVVPSNSHSSVAKQVCNGRTNCIFTISERHVCINGNKETTYQQIKYECIKESEIRSMCTDQTWTSSSGFLTSANYPIFYPPRASCTCTLKTDDDSFILLKTAEFLLKNSSPCRDYLQVEPESNPEEILCGSLHRIFEARAFTLHFQTELTSFKGFLLSYEATSGVKASCRQNPQQRPKLVTTPTPPKLPTTLSTTTPELDSSIEDLESLKSVHDTEEHRTETETTSFTDMDSIAMSKDEDGSNSKDPDIVSDRKVSYHPPQNEDELPPVEIVQKNKELVSSPIHMVSGCFGDIVHFQCKDGELIRIVQDLYGSAPSGRCSYEENDCVVEAVGQKSIVSQICSSKTRCMNFIVTRMFCGDRVTSYQQITYECVPATAMLNICSRRVMKSAEGYLASPNFPGMYPRNQSCSCFLRAEGDIIRLSMAHFALHDLKTCEDWLEIKLGGGGPVHKLCGSQHGDFRSSSLSLNFSSDGKYSHSGFWLHFQGEKGGTVTMACNVPIDSVWPTDEPNFTVTSASTTQVQPASDGGPKLTGGSMPPGKSIPSHTPTPPRGSVRNPDQNSSNYRNTGKNGGSLDKENNDSDRVGYRQNTNGGHDTYNIKDQENRAFNDESSHHTTTTERHLTGDMENSSGVLQGHTLLRTTFIILAMMLRPRWN